MKMNLTSALLEDGKAVCRDCELTLDQLEYDFGTFPIRKKSPVHIQVVKDEKDHLTVSGSASLTVEVPCDRCLDSVEVPLTLEFEDEISAKAEDETDTDSAFEQNYYFEGYNLDVDKLISGEALLSWPTRVLCKEDCAGLCPVCGQNLNRGQCGCDRTQLDPRMAKVLDVFSSMKKEV